MIIIRSSSALIGLQPLLIDAPLRDSEKNGVDGTDTELSALTIERHSTARRLQTDKTADGVNCPTIRTFF
jgi:hypothetical protein